MVTLPSVIDATTLAVTAIYGVLGLAMAIFIFTRGPGMVVNRVLAAMFVIEGLSSSVDLARLTDAPPALRHGVETVFDHFLYPVIGPLYLLFIFHALPRPSTRFMRTSRARWILLGLAFALILTAILVDVHRNVWRATTLGTSLFGLVWAFQHWRRAQGAVRRKATAFLIAFGLRDLGFVVGLSLILADPAARTGETGAAGLVGSIGNLIIVVGLFTYAIALGIGVLRSQILDFEFHFHKGVSRTTIAAIFVAVFFVVSELAASVLSDRFGTVLGITATGLLVFAISPLMRLGDKVGSAVVEDARPISQRTPQDHLAMYRDQVELALEDGQMTSKEIRMLEQVRDRLRVPADVAMEIQASVAAGHRTVRTQAMAA